MAKLTVFQNETNKSADTQFQQINLALQNIANWANRLKSSVLLTISDNSAQTTSSTAYVNIPGYSSSFKAVSPLIRIDTSLYLDAAGGGTGTIALVLDGAIKREVKITGTTARLVTFTDVITTYPGSHNLSYQWKSTSGAINKGLDGGSQILIMNIV